MRRARAADPGGGEMPGLLWWVLTVVYAPDYEKWMRWCPVIASHPLTCYARTDVHYPPLGSLLPTLVWYVGHVLLGLDPWDWRFRVLWKLPVWVGALACLYCARRVGVGESGLLVIALSSVYSCAFWQLDPISVALALAAVRWSGRWVGGALAALAFCVKPTAGVVALPFLRRWRSVAVFGLTALVILSPYLVVDGRSFLRNVVLFQVDRPPQNCSIWTLLPPPDGVPVALLVASVLGPLVLPGRPERRACAIGAALLAFSKVVNPNYWSVSCAAACLESERWGALLLSSGLLFLIASGLYVSSARGYFNAEDGRFYPVHELFVPRPPEPPVRVPLWLAEGLLDGAIVYSFLTSSWVYARCVLDGWPGGDFLRSRGARVSARSNRRG